MLSKTTLLQGLRFFFLLAMIVGVGFFISEDGWTHYSKRIETNQIPKTTFTYYFFWYDNNSHGDAANTLHIYNNPAVWGPFYVENGNYSLIESTHTIPASDYLLYNISHLHSQKTDLVIVDFDMLQSHVNCTNEGDTVEVFGLHAADLTSFQEAPMSSTAFKWGYETGNELYHRLESRRFDVDYLVIRNPAAAPVEYTITSTVFNDTLSYHIDGSKFEGDFSYKNKNWHKYEIEGIMRAGIDVILPVYWGSWSGEFNTVGMEQFSAALLELEEAHGLDAVPKIAMFMDTTGWITRPGVANLTSPEGKAMFAQFISEFFSYLPERFLYRPDGRDLVWMYGAGWATDYSDETFTYARQNYTATFGEGRDLIFVGVGFSKAQASLIGTYTWGVSLSGAVIGQHGIAIGAVGPGFYSEGAYRCGCQLKEGIRSQPRRDGDFYQEQFRKIMRGSRWIVIEVWNELHEGNQICETVEHGDLYINLTRQLIEEYKNTPLWDWREFDTYLTIWIGVGCLAGIITIILKKGQKLALSLEK
jgi:hypothetical protein